MIANLYYHKTNLDIPIDCTIYSQWRVQVYHMFFLSLLVLDYHIFCFLLVYLHYMTHYISRIHSNSRIHHHDLIKNIHISL